MSVHKFERAKKRNYNIDCLRISYTLSIHLMASRFIIISHYSTLLTCLCPPSSLELGVPTWMSLRVTGGPAIAIKKPLLTGMALGVCGLVSWNDFLDTWRVAVYHFQFSRCVSEHGHAEGLEESWWLRKRALQLWWSPCNTTMNKGHWLLLDAYKVTHVP